VVQELRGSLNVVDKQPHFGIIKVLAGTQKNAIIRMNVAVTTIGSDIDNDIILTDTSVSPHYARILQNDQSWSIETVNVQDTLDVNKRHVQRAMLYDYDIVGIGTETTFIFLLSPTSQALSNSIARNTQPLVEDAITPLTKATLPPEPNSVEVPISKQASLVQQSAPASPTRIKTSALPSLQLHPVQEASEDSGQLHKEVEGTLVTPISEMGMPFLEISSNTQQERMIFPLIRHVLNIGRDASNDILLDESYVSSFHAQIVFEENQFVFLHPHPTRKQTQNGVLYRGRQIAGDEVFRKPLARGDIFRIGDESGTFVSLIYNDGSGTSQEMLPEIHPIPLMTSEITIGRHADNTVVLNHPQVSSHHARLIQEDGTYRIVDLNSTNHVYVNALLATSQLLKRDDEVRIGPYRLTYTGTELTQHDESNGINVNALHLKKVGNKQAVLLNDISLFIPARKFVALVGGSGAGKSTLMDALNGLRPAQEGKVFYNGQDYYHNPAVFSRQLGYVPQDDIVHRDLTVERALYYAARMRLPEDFTNEQIEQRIDEVLDDVDMKERRHLRISTLSGGQRKRVSIALELLSKPSIFFLDEPTSGLDPGLDRKMMFLLRKLADKGHTVILVTHATNNINTCDYVCFLAQGGRLVYFGPPSETRTYFGKTDFAEIYAILEPSYENPNAPEEAEVRFKSSPDYQNYVAEPVNEAPLKQGTSQKQPKERKTVKHGNPWKQFLLLSLRYIELLKNDPGNLLILLLQAPVVALLLLLLVKYEVGTSVFNATTITKCPTAATILTNTGLPVIPGPANPVVSIQCSRVSNFLKNDPAGKAFAAKQGGERAALQSFIALGSGADAQKVLFIMAFTAVLFGSVNAAREIVKEEAVYRRERAVNLNILPYMFSKITVLSLLCLLQTALLVLIINIAVPFQQGLFLPPLLEIYITMALTALTGLMLGLTISAIAPNTDRAMSFIPIILIPQVIFSGTVFAFKDWFTQILSLIFASRWSMAALGSSVGLHSDKIGGDKIYGDNYIYHGFLFSTYSQTDAIHYLLLMWGALVVMIVLFCCIIAVFLKRKDIRR
jgi:ABC-type multidrug transport system ATPase subunit